MDSFFLSFFSFSFQSSIDLSRRERADVLQLFTSYTKKWEIASDRVFNSYEQRVTYELCMRESRLLRNARTTLLPLHSRRKGLFSRRLHARSRKWVSSYLYTIETANSDYSYVLIRLIACIYCIIHRMRVSSKRNRPMRRYDCSLRMSRFFHASSHRLS